MDDLISRIEAATEGSRELDAEIAFEALEWSRVGGQWMRGEDFEECDLPAFSTSLDAAVTLVPDGWEMTDICWGANGRDGDGVTAYLVKPGLLNPENTANGTAADAKLAVCAAALRARRG